MDTVLYECGASRVSQRMGRALSNEPRPLDVLVSAQQQHHRLLWQDIHRAQTTMVPTVLKHPPITPLLDDHSCRTCSRACLPRSPPAATLLHGEPAGTTRCADPATGYLSHWQIGRTPMWKTAAAVVVVVQEDWCGECSTPRLVLPRFSAL